MNPSENFSESIVEFLVNSYDKQDRIEDALERVKQETNYHLDGLMLPLEVLEEASLTTALNSIQSQVNTQFSQLSSKIKFTLKADYMKLRNLLAAGEWKAADEETALVMFKVANREQEGLLRVKDIDNFPCEDLKIIDRLWVDYSKGKFGFSVQKEIYQSLGGTREYNQRVCWQFGDAVGWRVNNQWIDYSDVTFSLEAPQGNLPEGAWCPWGVAYISSLASRLVDWTVTYKAYKKL